MCGFAGFAGFNESLWEERYLWGNLGKRMGKRLSHRGPDDNGTHVSENCVLSHARLSVMDPLFGKQPMSCIYDGFEYTIAYNGEIYNAPELKKTLTEKGYYFETNCDTEVLLKTYVEFGDEAPALLNGIYAFAIDDKRRKRIFMCRDRFGVKPFFYTFSSGRIVFGSEIKALFEYPGIKAVIDREGLCEIFGLGPARTPGCGVYKDIFELKPGYIGVFDSDGFKEKKYFSLMSHTCEESYEGAVEKVRELLYDIGKRQLVADVPVCTFLSGGLDSSVISALAAKELTKKGKQLDTYSFDYEGNNKFFTPSDFQPSADEPWAQLVSEHLDTNHTTLTCSNNSLFYSLYDSVIAKDLPGMADVDSSLLHFCREVKKKHVVALCGECADEVFGGYPWFRNPEINTFPWSKNIGFRESFLKPELADAIDINSYINKRYQETLWDTPLISGESEDETRRRQMSFLNIKWFMQTLLDRKDRCSMYSGLEVRVPYADHRLIEYVYNTPWDYKCHNGIQKSLLRDAAVGLLPEDIIYRKKSPYPKTHNPEYENMLKSKLKFILMDSLQPIHKILSPEAAKGLLTEKFDYGKPWFGQLMAGPQLLAYLIQINYWMIRYNIYLDI